MSKQREAFEAWYGENYSQHALKTWREWKYDNLDTELAWQAYQAAQQAQWLPIESAPKEELRDLIVFNGNVQHGQWWEGYWVDSSHDFMEPQPTLWMPLPPEPKK